MGTITKTMVAALVLAAATACAGAGSGPDLGSVQPCDLLAPAQLADAGLAAGRPAGGGPASSCSWMPEGSGFGVPVVLTVLPGTDLAETREVAAVGAGAGLGAAGDLADAEVGGLPALRSTGEICLMYVDVGSGLLGLAGAGDCAAQQRMMEAALANLPA